MSAFMALTYGKPHRHNSKFRGEGKLCCCGFAGSTSSFSIIRYLIGNGYQTHIWSASQILEVCQLIGINGICNFFSLGNRRIFQILLIFSYCIIAIAKSCHIDTSAKTLCNTCFFIIKMLSPFATAERIELITVHTKKFSLWK